MKYGILEENILDMIKEEQLKLGYRKEPVTLYYLHASVNHMLDTDLKTDGFEDYLAPFCEMFTEKYGKIYVKSDDRRITVTVSEDVSEYVHENMKDTEFISRFIKLVSGHGVTIEDIHSLFLEYSENVHFEKMDNGEFDYLIYFEDGKPDSYRYCITDEIVHFIYHRYTKFDYEDFGF